MHLYLFPTATVEASIAAATCQPFLQQIQSSILLPLHPAPSPLRTQYPGVEPSSFCLVPRHPSHLSLLVEIQRAELQVPRAHDVTLLRMEVPLGVTARASARHNALVGPSTTAAIEVSSHKSPSVHPPLPPPFAARPMEGKPIKTVKALKLLFPAPTLQLEINVEIAVNEEVLRTHPHPFLHDDLRRLELGDVILLVIPIVRHVN